MMNSVPRIEMKGLKTKQHEVRSIRTKGLALMKSLFIKRGMIYTLVGLLLGRAIILSAVSPFAIAFLATIWYTNREHTAKVTLAILIGSISISGMQSANHAIGICLFLFLATIFEHKGRPSHTLPLFVFMATTLTRFLLSTLSGPVTSYEWLLLFVEGVLGSVLVLIFMQSMPLLSPKRYKQVLKHEEIICMIILLASILSGTIGWLFYGIAVEQVFSRYFVLVLSYVGGAAIGSTVGVVAGLILSLADVSNLSEMSLLAFSGLLGGLLKDGRKIGVAAGLLIGTMLMVVYANEANWLYSMLASLSAVFLFCFTPRRLSDKLASFIPGTEAYSHEQEQYLQKVRNVTARRVEQFSHVFEALSKSFVTKEEHLFKEGTDNSRETDYFLSEVTEKTCQLCFMKDRCWQEQFDDTYALMGGLKEMLIHGHEPKGVLLRNFENHCVKPARVLETMQEEVAQFAANRKLKQQVHESKQLVAEQLQGVSEVMDDFAQEILRERQEHEQQEKQIIQALEDMNITIEKLDIYELEKGNVEIDMTVQLGEYRGETHKLIAPVLSDILHEAIVVKEEAVADFPAGYCEVVFGSAKKYTVESGVATVAKDGGLVSGDSYKTIELGTGKFAMAISDGMGNGVRANEESGETLRLLQQILQTGIPEKVAIKSINSILTLRSTDEIFATLDLAVLNLHNASVKFLKIGSTPSFIKRGREVIAVEGSNLPIGIIREFDVDMIHEQLEAEDLLIMMSDGIFEGPQNVGNVDEWLKATLRQITTNDPQDIADLLIEEVMRVNHGVIFDDMTVVVTRIEKTKPKWSSIPIQLDKEA